MPTSKQNNDWVLFRTWLRVRLMQEFAGYRAAHYRDYVAGKIQNDCIAFVVSGKSEEAKQFVESLLLRDGWWRELSHPIEDNTKCINSHKLARARKQQGETK